MLAQQEGVTIETRALVKTFARAFTPECGGGSRRINVNHREGIKCACVGGSDI
jgi:hypothetical protein